MQRLGNSTGLVTGTVVLIIPIVSVLCSLSQTILYDAKHNILYVTAVTFVTIVTADTIVHHLRLLSMLPQLPLLPVLLLLPLLLLLLTFVGLQASISVEM